MKNKLKDKKENVPNKIEIKHEKKCSDFDEDCAKVNNHFRCWIGNDTLARADGLCPFIHNNN